MENIPNTEQQHKIEAYLFGLRTMYQTMAELTEKVGVGWENEQNLDDFRELAYYHQIADLLCQEVERVSPQGIA